MNTAEFHGFEPNFDNLLTETNIICKEVDSTLEDPKSADIHELLVLQYRLTEIGERVTAYLSPAEV